jgi:gluconolactonase
MDHAIELIASGFGFPEGPCFDAADDFHFVDGRSGWIERVHREGTVEHFVNTGGGPNGAVFDRDNTLFICEARNSQILRYAGGELTVVADSFGGEPFRGPNDLTLHPDGAIYFTDPGGSGADNPIGRIYRIEGDGTVRLLAEGFAFCNGLAFSPDASLLYVAETSAHRLIVFEVAEDGSLGAPEDFAPTPGGVGGDGLCLDVEGNLYMAHFGAGVVAVFSPEGQPLDRLPAGGEKPTNVAFGGPDMRELWVTEAETAAIYRLRPGIQGLRPFRDPRPAASD